LQAEDPLQTLVIAGQSCKVHRNSELHAANENGDGLIPWNGQQDNLIDRFDGRALLDFYRDPPAHRMDPPKGHDEMKLDEVRHMGSGGLPCSSVLAFPAMLLHLQPGSATVESCT
jgi:arginine/serine-rich splicing factor 16